MDTSSDRFQILQEEIDRRIYTLRREDEALDKALRQYVQGVEEKFSTLIGEQQKTGEAIVLGLRKSISEGDERLREHVASQVQQIRDSLQSAGLLELERVNLLRTSVEALRRELEISNDASKEAVLKSEIATEKRFESVNEWRAQSADRERSQQEDRATFTATLMPREVADTQFNELRTRVEGLQNRQNTLMGQAKGVLEAKEEKRYSSTAVVAIAAVGVSVFNIAVVIATNILTAH